MGFIKETKKHEIDMTDGPLLGKIFLFFIPVMLSGVLQLLFNATDIVVVGQFAGDNALGAVGASSSLINLLTNVFLGLSVGTNVLVARYYGAKQNKELHTIVHTSITTALISGCILVLVGLVFAGPLLTKMNTPAEILNQAVLYMRLYFLGMPAMMCYNFGSAILRAVGDTKRPLYFLFIAGIINVILNLIFVIPLKMDVAGVALATIFSQCISAFLVLRCIMKTEESYKLIIRDLKIDKDKFLKMMHIGLPAGIQGALFSLSNVLIQSSINTFGNIAVAGNTAASNIEGFVYTAMNALYQTCISFGSQNYGAKKFKRILKTLLLCLLLVIIVGLVLGNTVYFTSPYLLRLYTKDASAIQYGINRLSIICTLYFLCGIMDVAVGGMRSMGYAITPLIVSLSGACLFRIIWIFTIFQQIHTLECLYWSYPISWTLTFTTHIICFTICYRKLWKQFKA